MEWGVNVFVEIKTLNKSYQSKNVRQDVLKGVSLQAEQESIAVILGPSGSGKSTLMNIIGGVDRADNGKVFVDGIEVSALNDNRLTDYRRDSVGFVFQYYNLIGKSYGIQYFINV